jgi:hypothetical protein
MRIFRCRQNQTLVLRDYNFSFFSFFFFFPFLFLVLSARVVEQGLGVKNYIVLTFQTHSESEYESSRLSSSELSPWLLLFLQSPP